MPEDVYHIPALLPEAINLLNIKPDGTYIDATFGGGGHSRAIIEALGPNGHLYSFDRDMDAFANRIDDPRFTFVHSNFRFIENFMRYHDAGKADGILADLGVSFHHFDSSERGFSFRSDAPLDMRMNRRSSMSAAEFLATSTEERIATVLGLYGELKQARRMAAAIVREREAGRPVDTVGRLTAPGKKKKKLAQVFKAIRIETNDEMGDLRHFLQASLRVLSPGGRLAMLTYHSVEDRMVKNFMKTGNIDGKEDKDFFGKLTTPWRLITRKPIEPSAEEIEANPRSRSAKLRVAELLYPEAPPDK